jgi:hypothetical protein
MQVGQPRDVGGGDFVVGGRDRDRQARGHQAVAAVVVAARRLRWRGDVGRVAFSAAKSTGTRSSRSRAIFRCRPRWPGSPRRGRGATDCRSCRCCGTNPRPRRRYRREQTLTMSGMFHKIIHK